MRRVPGVVIALVTNVNDPLGLGRIQLQFPWMDPDLRSWARVAAPMAGSKRGAFFMPEVDDEVLVGFEHGDFNRPYVLGSLWNGVDKPPLTASEAVKDGVVKRIFKTRAGHVIQLDDSSGQEKIEIIDKSKKNKVIIDTAANTIEISATRKIKLSAPEVEISGETSVKISGAQIESNASGVQTIKGGTVQIN